MPQETESLIAGRYALEEKLGKGGMGVVWSARDTLLKREVAVKEVHIPAAVRDEERNHLEERVLREARAAARLTHPNVVTMFDVVREDGTAYIVMELVRAPTLSDLVEAEGPLSVEQTAEVGLRLLDALEAAHERGIVHRDVKPGNVMVPQSGFVKLADFGIASVKGDPKLTATGMILGSPSYMAPEQAHGAGAGPETDLWALGATLYFAVEGVAPFDRQGAIATLTSVVNDEPREPRRAGALAPLLSALLSKEPAERPSIPEVRRLLDELEGEGQPLREASETALLYDEDGPATPPSPARVARRGQDNPSRWLLAVAVVALALLALFAVPALLGDDRQPAETEEQQEQEPAQTEEQPEEPPAEEEQEAAPDVPPDWTTYSHGPTGYTIAYPSDWEVIEGTGAGADTDFRDPETGRYLRVGWTDTPGDDPVAAWRQQSQAFAGNHENYREIRIEPTTYKGLDAALWEYTYSSGGVDLHAYNLGFVTDTYGFALNLQSREADWATSQQLFEDFKESFELP